PTHAQRNTPTPSPSFPGSSTSEQTNKIQWQSHPIPGLPDNLDQHSVCQSNFLTAGQGAHIKDDSLTQDSRSDAADGRSDA
ncbi:hypothetical protein ACFVW2_40020, partial [Streptomyces sp. NPDC058171]